MFGVECDVGWKWLAEDCCTPCDSAERVDAASDQLSSGSCVVEVVFDHHNHAVTSHRVGSWPDPGGQ
jgi:hypothetical protein